MTEANKGAFSLANEQIDLTKREYFAALAMQGLAAFPGSIGGNSNPNARDVAKKSVEYADELIAALNNNE